MTIQKNGERSPVGPRQSSTFLLLIVAISLAAIVATYFVANSRLDVMPKTTGFGSIVMLYLIVCIYIVRTYSVRQRKGEDSDVEANSTSEKVEQSLRSLEEAAAFLAGSLKPSDAFRLVSSRVRDLMPFKSIVLYLLDETRTHLLAVEAEGAGVPARKGKVVDLNHDLAGQCYLNRQVEVADLNSTENGGSSVAVPLCRDTSVFGVLQLFFDADYDVAAVDRSLFEAIATRVAPTILSSITFERNQISALTDITTDLPNERAFYMVLENQVAETHRNPDGRPLTILSLDIRGFDEIIQEFGHGAGDRVLKFVAQIVKENLRQMDFFARSYDDEFLIVLPTATKSVSHDVIARLHTGFFGRKLKLNETEAVEIDLNIGWAAFGDDGDTPGQLLTLAKLRRDQVKSCVPRKVIIFPQEHVH